MRPSHAKHRLDFCWNGAAFVICVSSAASGNRALDRKSTRLNSSHLVISYAVFCLTKKRHDTLDAELAPAGVERSPVRRHAVGLADAAGRAPVAPGQSLPPALVRLLSQRLRAALVL